MVQVKGVNRNRLKYLKYSEFGFVSQPPFITYREPQMTWTRILLSCHPRLQGHVVACGRTDVVWIPSYKYKVLYMTSPSPRVFYSTMPLHNFEPNLYVTSSHQHIQPLRDSAASKLWFMGGAMSTHCPWYIRSIDS
jgi:hypothetical protein